MSTGYGWEGLRQVCATLLGARHVPERLCGGLIYLGRYNECSPLSFFNRTTHCEWWVIVMTDERFHSTHQSSIIVRRPHSLRTLRHVKINTFIITIIIAGSMHHAWYPVDPTWLSPLTNSSSWSWLREAVCLRHKGELSFKSWTFGPSFVWKWTKKLSTSDEAPDPTRASAAGPQCGEALPAIGSSSVLVFASPWEILYSLLGGRKPQLGAVPDCRNNNASLVTNQNRKEWIACLIVIEITPRPLLCTV